MPEKINTSIQYQISNSILPRRVFLKGQEFINKLLEGNDSFIDSIIEDWNNVRTILSKSVGFNVKDIKREVKREDIKLYVDGDPEVDKFVLVTVEFPQYEEIDGTCNIVGAYITDKAPRYFTFKNAPSSGKRKAYVFGELKLVTEDLFDPKEYEYTTNGSLDAFYDLVMKNIKK